ncbi:hypothetical protein McPS_11290 [Marichromatium sp. PS1]|uniref:hypothetical protein n=1 Tax=Marichromatium sp. PS1 TaxID=3138932 RepID=UPI0032E63FB7
MKKNDLKLPKTYKTLLMLALVFGPFFWLTFTDDGKRCTDLALMYVLGKSEFNAALESFDSDLTEARLRETFADLELQCADGPNPYGDRLCGAAIGSFNQMPASAVTFFFRDGQLRATKLVYRRAYHQRIGDWIAGRVATRGDALHRESEVRDSGGVRQLAVADGAIFLRDGELGKDEEPALLWLSQAALAGR